MAYKPSMRLRYVYVPFNEDFPAGTMLAWRACRDERSGFRSIGPNHRCNSKSSMTLTRKAFAILRIESSVGLAIPRSISLMNA